MFHNEIELLEIRLDYLYNTVDYFVISEAKISHSRKFVKDEYNFIKNKKKYKKYLDKIIFLPIDEYPEIHYDATLDIFSWYNENYQRKNLFNGFKNCNDDDIIIISDIDEIPFKTTIYKAIDKLNTNKFLIGVNQKLFYYYVNIQKSHVWQGTYLTKKKYLGNHEKEIKDNIQLIRNSRTSLGDVFLRAKSFSQLIKERTTDSPGYEYIGTGESPGGVHYSWFVSIIKEKFNSIAEHDVISIFNNETHINNCITKNIDLFNRDGIFGQQEVVTLNENNSLSNINKFIEKYPHIYFTPPPPVILVNDYCYGLLGERVLWNFMLESIPNLKAVDLDILSTDLSINKLDIPFEEKVIKYIEKHYPSYKCIIQNGSWFNLIPSKKPRICLIQDNLRKMDRKNQIQENNFKNSEFIVVNSKETGDYYNERESYKIPLGVDNKLFNIKDKNSLRKEYFNITDPNKKIGIFIGALNEVKGWSRIKDIIIKNKDIFWIVVSKHNEKLENITNVYKYSKISQEGLCDLYNMANFFIIGSPTETQCLAAIEACLCNTPIIMRNTGFVTDLNDNEKTQIGIIGDDLEGAVKIIIKNNKVFTPRNIILKYFSIEEMNKKWIKLIDEI